MVYSIIVTYKQNYEQFKKTVTSLETQCDKIILVKNSKEPLEYQSNKIVYLQLDKNYGIAYAQNRGIEIAIKEKAEFILFSDQDTIFPENYVDDCIKSYKNNENKYEIAAIVPLFYNENKQQMSQIMIDKTHAIDAEIGKVYELSHAISSGSFIPAKAIEKIGIMNERMFIDFVDNEWCWRANRLGCSIICDTNIVINHSMGDNFKEIFGRKFVVYSDFRNYFFFRNAYYLLYHSKLFSTKDFLNFYKFIKIKTIIYFLTKGVNIKNISLLLKAKNKGIFNKFSLEEELK